jgi:hypothetical protein
MQTYSERTGHHVDGDVPACRIVCDVTSVFGSCYGYEEKPVCVRGTQLDTPSRCLKIAAIPGTDGEEKKKKAGELDRQRT